MVNAVYDHIIAILVICVMFVGAVVILPTLSVANIQAVDQQQLRNTALNVFNAMLLDTGVGFDGVKNRTDWGSIDPFSADCVSRFGLASSWANDFYVLDPDKVCRLVKDNAIGELPYSKVKELLGLQSYDFAFQIIPPFNVTTVDGKKIDKNNPPIDEAALEKKKLQYAVKVSDLFGKPIPNAVIYGMTAYTNKDNFYINYTNVVTTDALGIGSDTITLKVVPWHIMVVLRVSVADVATIVVTFGKDPVNIIDINIAGDTVILTRPKDAPNAEVKLENVWVYGSQGSLSFLYKGSTKDHFNTGSGQYRLWSKTFNKLQRFNPVVLVFQINTVPENNEPRQEVVIAGPYEAFLGHTVFNFGIYPWGEGAVRLQRSVVIAGLTYIAELWLWKGS